MHSKYHTYRHTHVSFLHLIIAFIQFFRHSYIFYSRLLQLTINLSFKAPRATYVIGTGGPNSRDILDGKIDVIKRIRGINNKEKCKLEGEGG